MKDILTLLKLKKSQYFEEYFKLITDEDCDDDWKLLILKSAIAFLNSEDQDLKKLGYRIIVLYSSKFEEYESLYDVSINLGYFPIVKLLENLPEFSVRRDSFFQEFQDSYVENYKTSDYYATYEQSVVRRDLKLSENGNSYAVVAPTSYGKSELIEMSWNLEGAVCILVPTKALLAQTKRRLLKNIKGRVIVTHPEMDIPEDRSLVTCVMTQERLVRFLQLHDNFKFSYVFIDEAHNLLDDNDRSRLLAVSLIMLKKRNHKASFIYLTPFVNDVENLKVKNLAIDTKELRVKETIKTEKYFLCDLRKSNEVKYYDQFFNRFEKVALTEADTEVDFVKENAAKKNIIYLNKPADAQHFAKLLAESLEIVEDNAIDEAIKDIKELTHDDYDLIFCLKRGVVYHHGSISDNIKLFSEHLYTVNKSLKFIVTTSTLLEGVNIPAEKLFLLDHRRGKSNLTQSHFKNLVGRVCRFKEIFDTENGNASLLAPHVYLVGSRYMPSNADLMGFLSRSVKIDKNFEDKSDNILLENSELDDDQRKIYSDYGEFINNLEPGTMNDVESRLASTDFGEECFRNNIFELDIFSNEKQCQKEIERLKANGVLLSDPLEIMESIANIFLKKIKDDDEDRFRSLLRLREVGARNFYAMLLRWRLENTSVREMVAMFLHYWEELIETQDEPYVFVGKWGEEARSGFLPRWINIAKKTKIEKINLAIVRIKDEFDFLDNTLIKFIEVLHSLELVEEEIYSLIKYGTSNKTKIMLVKSGMSLQLTNLILKSYRKFVVRDQLLSQLSLKSEILNEMKGNNESQLMIFEAKFHIR